jgi:phosphoribosylformimino-5-aminoimidazole carboxamide ribotide isomerase
MTKFRPCIDIHQGKVKQIVGGTLSDGDIQGPKENFVSDRPPSYYAAMYAADKLTGGHVIMLGQGNDDAAREALAAWPGGLQVGGGIHPGNARDWLDAGASHVIVTSYMFNADGTFADEKLAELIAAVGKDRLVIDLSCRSDSSGGWTVAMNRWQTLTDLPVTHKTLDRLADSCAEFLIHAADVEGKCDGIDESLVTMLGQWAKISLTYAGGARSLADLQHTNEISGGNVDLTIGSALDIFGGTGVTYAECKVFNQSETH